MALHLGPWLLLAATWTGTPDPPDHRSHVPVPARDGDARKLFDKRWQTANALKELYRGAPGLLTPGKLKELARRFQDQGIDLDDPEFRKQIEAMLRQKYPGVRLTPAQVEALLRLVKNTFPEPGKMPPGEPAPDKRPAPDQPKPKSSEPPSGPPSSGPPTEPASPEEEERQAEANRQLFQFAQGLERFADSLNESPTLQQTFRDLGAMAFRHAGESPNGTPSDLNTRLAELNRLGNTGNRWFARNWPHLRSLDLPRLSAPRLPSVSWPWRRPSLPATLSSGGRTDTWTALLSAILVAALVVALGKLLGQYAGKPPQRTGDDWQLGPWPVNPAQVHTRAELIRTFEYLSLLRLGRQVRTWNHHAIAHSLAGEQSSPERQAALHLADLYEQARYAPADHSLSAETLESYRRNLCLLAGVANA